MHRVTDFGRRSTRIIFCVTGDFFNFGNPESVSRGITYDVEKFYRHVVTLAILSSVYPLGAICFDHRRKFTTFTIILLTVAQRCTAYKL